MTMENCWTALNISFFFRNELTISLFSIFLALVNADSLLVAKTSMYMMQFRATNLLENLLDFHQEGVLLLPLQLHKCSMSYLLVTLVRKVLNNFVCFVILIYLNATHL
jgi:hypothetical protein